MAQALLVRRGGGGASGGGLPEFTYTGTYTLIDDGDKNWRIKFLTSGTFVSQKSVTIDVFCVGGGGSTYYVIPNNYSYVAGAGGGYTATLRSVVVEPNVEYSIVVGAGMAGGTNVRPSGQGGSTSAFNLVVGGGYCSTNHSQSANIPGAAGGSGGGDSVSEGGVDGVNGGGTRGGLGQGTTTREFGEPTGDLYASGGHGSYGSTATIPANGLPNTGDGGSSGGNAYMSYAGGSGIVVIRNHREAVA